MNRSEFIKILKTLSSIELHRYELDKIAESLRQTAAAKKESLSQKITCAQNANASDHKSFVRAGFLKFILGLLAAFAIGVGISIAILLVSTFINLILLWRFESLLEKIVIICLILPFVAVIIAAVKMIALHNTAVKDIRNRKPLINRWRDELVQVQKNCDSQLTILAQEKQKYEQPLSALYTVIPIYPKYRNAAALASFTEYFETGRCSSLEGPDGAYNLYESEIRMNAILSKLDDVILNLKQIQQNQYTLYHGMMQVKNNIDVFSSVLSEASDQMRSMEEDLRVQNYYSALHAQQQEYTNYALGVRSYGTGFVSYH